MKPFIPVLCALLFAGTGLRAHECWLQPSTFAPAVGAEVKLAIKVGMQFQGEAKPFSPARVQSLRSFSLAGSKDLHPPLDGELAFATTFASPGTQVIAYDSPDSLITLESGKFQNYLREEGLDAIITQRETAGEATRPGRERYRRCVKSILQVGGKADAGYAVRTGQRLELVPLNDPAAVPAGGTIRFLLLLEGQPLTGSLVRAWHRTGDHLTTLDARSDAKGVATFALPAAGEWMLSTVHMQRTQGDSAADWESLWGNLTFALAVPPPATGPQRGHPVQGVIMGVMPNQTALLVKHEEVPGVMRAMTMMFKVEPAVLTQVKRGDAIKALMSRREDGWWLTEVVVAGPAK
jgi:uncharacterized GH25 family protein/Cu/Ag efflux protein CusF